MPVVVSRSKQVSRVFTDENLDRLSHLLDDQFRFPGTSFRFGLDGIVGLIPGFGDIAGGVASCILIFAAWVRGVPYVTLVRMLVNVGLEVILGTVPFFGDLFDIAWKANRRNYALLTLHAHQPRSNTGKDWLFLLSLALLGFAIFMVPVMLLIWVASLLAHSHPF